MHILALSMPSFVPAGAFIAILGGLAAIMSLSDAPTGLKKTLWIGVFFVLMVCEILVLRRDQRTGEEHYTYLVTRFNSTDSLISANAQAQLRVAELPPVRALPLPPKPSPSKPITDQSALLDLKRRASVLSAEILQFLTQRQSGEPPLPRPDTWDKDVSAEIQYMGQTMALYTQRFASSVIAIHDELAKSGFKDNELDRSYEHPTNPLGVQAVGEHLGALAEQIR